MQISYDTTDISTSTYATAIDTAVVDAGFACSISNNSTNISSCSDIDIIQYDILDNSTLSVCNQRSRQRRFRICGDGMKTAIDRTCKWIFC